jgi:hypothetical protein
MDAMEEAKQLLLSAQSINSNEWYGEQFQKGLDEISTYLIYQRPVTMRTIPQIILSLSELSIMMNNNGRDKILRLQKKLWDIHKF